MAGVIGFNLSLGAEASSEEFNSMTNLSTPWPAQRVQPATAVPSPTLDQVRIRVGSLLPELPYVTDAEFAKAIGLSPKTLANRRAANPGCLPHPLRIWGNKAKRHAREDLVEWMANEEMRARGVVVHHCR